ncbi:hypothetical protein TcCL_ESM11679 [Trypanosoma cruzi]|uniref:Uncharacterized protein n=1 Tax=Trypanosoma cruzi (strain CL Brener) TaxID=353153 RepID=Q4DWZ6_TRYCC|nr:hypothetical protein, conserved [Trypanosoma cruzi]EAN97062.1 hypothetical protein, conserved [Trypanosoma cruzi]RNC51224.1 hypothetical protein TcCL_ESM11679 [Trypanosoma cruzi]|eukprot:XP_818913.1 hypothetical protein [Trypanosoma cruzi strain CL Brener]
MERLLKRVGLLGEQGPKTHDKSEICGVGECGSGDSSCPTNADLEFASAVTPKTVTVTSADEDFGAAGGSDTVAVGSSFSSGMDKHLLAVARASEFSALKRLELCQQELLQLQRMWDLDRETQRWTVASLREEVRHLQKQLEQQRLCGWMQRTREKAIVTRNLSTSPESGVGASLRHTADREAGRANSVFEASATSGTGDASARAEETCLGRSSGGQRTHAVGASSGAEEVEDSLEFYGLLLHDANGECGELQAELSRVVRRLHDERRFFVQQISSLLREKEEMVREHATTLAHLDETKDLLMAARAAERAALRRLTERCPGESARVYGGRTADGGEMGTVYCSRCGCSSTACSELLRSSVDFSVERHHCNSLAVRQSALEEEVCILECEVERDTRNAEGLRRVLERLIDEVDVHVRGCRAANKDIVGCLREISLLWLAEGDEKDDEDDEHKSDDGMPPSLLLLGGDGPDGDSSPECAPSSAVRSHLLSAS